MSSADSLRVLACRFSITTVADKASGKLNAGDADAVERGDSKFVFGAVLSVNSSGIPASESSAKAAPDVASGGE